MSVVARAVHFSAARALSAPTVFVVANMKLNSIVRVLVAGVCAIAIPLALWEMRNLLARQNVHISLRITVAASLFCMIWPWLGQFDDSIQERMTWPSTVAGVPPPNSPARLARPTKDLSKETNAAPGGLLTRCIAAASSIAVSVRSPLTRTVGPGQLSVVRTRSSPRRNR